jgi:hypothetical protein
MCCGGTAEDAAEARGLIDALWDPQDQAERMARLGLISGLFEASAPSTDPAHGSLGYALGQGLRGAMAGMEQGSAIDARQRAAGLGPVDVRTQEQCDRLPPGSVCRFPDGRTQVRL